MNGWNLADIWEAHAARFPDAAALVHADRRIPWAAFDRRADGVAGALLAAGLGRQSTVAQYLYNCPEYLETIHACAKAAFVPVNTNYRYTDDELVYLWDNADAAAVVFHATFTPVIERIRDRVPGVLLWLCVDDGHGPRPAWATPYESAAASGASRCVGPWGRSGDDLMMLYTGGTTGYPKGVMWRQDDIVMLLDQSAKRPLPAEPSPGALEERVAKPGIIAIAAAPLMHGTGLFNAINTLMLAGCVVTMEGRHFDPEALLDTIDRERVTSMSIVGDAFAKPIVRALDGSPGRWDFSSMRVMMSSGVMWSAESKAALLRHNPRLIMIDSLGSSEAMGMAVSTTDGASGASAGPSTATFKLSANTRVITEDGRDVVPGSGEQGLVALRGRTPVGYYKDPVKSAATFRVIDGVRYSVPGDWASVDADGTLRLLGRGSQCINTGGEKVFPEEVEEALKHHPAVLDAAVVGVPDDRFGEAVTALVEMRAGADVDDAGIVAHVRAHLAAYKSPKRIIRVATIGRAPNGKLDYKRLRELAIAATA